MHRPNRALTRWSPALLMACLLSWPLVLRVAADGAASESLGDNLVYATTTGPRPASAPVTVELDGIQKLRATPLLSDGTMLLPVRQLGETLGALVKWQPPSTASLVGRSREVVLTVAETTAKVNGVSREMPCAPIMYENTLYGPARFIGEALGLATTWDWEKRRLGFYTALLSSAPPTVPEHTGFIIIPGDEFPMGQGKPIPIHVPSVIDGTNGSLAEQGWTSEQGWTTVATIERQQATWNWSKFFASFAVPDELGGAVDVGAAAGLCVVFGIISSAAQAYDVVEAQVTIQQNIHGELRAVVEMTDPNKTTVFRMYAGSRVSAGGFGNPAVDMPDMQIAAFAAACGLPRSGRYNVQLSSDAKHDGDPGIGYLSVSAEGEVAFTPKLYPRDRVVMRQLTGSPMFPQVEELFDLPLIHHQPLPREQADAIASVLHPAQLVPPMPPHELSNYAPKGAQWQLWAGAGNLDKKRPNVILIHGFTLHLSTVALLKYWQAWVAFWNLWRQPCSSDRCDSRFARLPDLLSTAGYNVWQFEYENHDGNTTSSIQTYAAYLEGAVDVVKRETGAERVSIIAHSMGGVIARAYVQFLKGHESVDKLLTLATPHFGTLAWGAVSDRVSDLGEHRVPDCVAEMRPYSSFLWTLNTTFDPAKYGVEFACIAGTPDDQANDGMVDCSSARLVKCQPDGTIDEETTSKYIYFTTVSCTHTEINKMGDERHPAYATIRRFLRDGVMGMPTGVHQPVGTRYFTFPAGPDITRIRFDTGREYHAGARELFEQGGIIHGQDSIDGSHLWSLIIKHDDGAGDATVYWTENGEEHSARIRVDERQSTVRKAPAAVIPDTEVTLAPTVTLTADPPEIAVGQSTALKWTSTDATTVVSSNFGAEDVEGTKTLSPTETTTYKITVKGPGGQAEASVTVVVRDTGEGGDSRGVTTQVSVAMGEWEANNYSKEPSISADGRYVAFDSGATNLVPGDTNRTSDVFVHDRLTGKTTRVSVATGGRQANGGSWEPSISADGRYVAFSSGADNLVPGDTNWTSDVFVHDRLTGKTTRVSVATGGRQADGPSNQPSISADGRYVAFSSGADHLVPGDPDRWDDIFVHDRLTGKTTRVSVAIGGWEGNGDSERPSISADGRYVAFQSGADHLVPGDTNDHCDVFVHDRWPWLDERQSTVRSDALAPGPDQPPTSIIHDDFTDAPGEFLPSLLQTVYERWRQPHYHSPEAPFLLVDIGRKQRVSLRIDRAGKITVSEPRGAELSELKTDGIYGDWAFVGQCEADDAGQDLSQGGAVLYHYVRSKPALQGKWRAVACDEGVGIPHEELMRHNVPIDVIRALNIWVLREHDVWVPSEHQGEVGP